MPRQLDYRPGNETDPLPWPTIALHLLVIVVVFVVVLGACVTLLVLIAD